MLHVICLRWGTLYGPEYVERLAEGVKRHLKRPHVFWCITEADLGDKFEGWWGKLVLFKPGFLPKGERILFLDLDTIITGDLTPLADYDGSLACLRDFYRPWGLGSGVMLWRAGEHANIWEEWEEHGCPRIEGGDQAMIEVGAPGAVRLQDRFPGMFVSFKAHCQAGLPEGASVVCFHGRPRPHEIKTGWVPKLWS